MSHQTEDSRRAIFFFLCLAVVWIDVPLLQGFVRRTAVIHRFDDLIFQAVSSGYFQCFGACEACILVAHMMIPPLPEAFFDVSEWSIHYILCISAAKVRKKSRITKVLPRKFVKSRD